MVDLGISKLAIVGCVAVLVIGPEKLPGVARTAGTLLGRLQRYVNGLKAEISQVAELDELRRMRQEMQQATSSFERNLHSMAAEVRHDLGVAKMFNSYGDVQDIQDVQDVQERTSWAHTPPAAPGSQLHTRTNWRTRRAATPQWYKARQRVRTSALSGAARVARYRPKKPLS